MWTKDISFTFDGTYAITAKATDSEGNVSNASGSLNITIDAIAVFPAGLDLDGIDDIGDSSSDNVTKLSSGLTIRDSGEVSAEIEIFKGLLQENR